MSFSWEPVGAISSGLTFFISGGLLFLLILRHSLPKCAACVWINQSKIEYSGRELFIFSIFVVAELVFCFLLSITSITSLAEPNFDSHHFTPARMVAGLNFMELQATLSLVGYFFSWGYVYWFQCFSAVKAKTTTAGK